MRRREPAEVESAGHESFLDVVTNIVCILIILVMIVGSSAHDMVVSEASAPAGPAQTAIDAQQTAVALEQDVNHLTREIATVQETAAAQFAERDRLSTILAAAEHELAQRRAALDDKTRHKYDLDRDKALAQADLDRLESELKQLASAPRRRSRSKAFRLRSAKVVDEKEAHFQLRQGRIAYVPFTEFAGKFRSLYEEKAHKLRDTDEITETYGPLYDFTIRYKQPASTFPGKKRSARGRGGATCNWPSSIFIPFRPTLANRSPTP